MFKPDPYLQNIIAEVIGREQTTIYELTEEYESKILHDFDPVAIKPVGMGDSSCSIEGTALRVEHTDYGEKILVISNDTEHNLEYDSESGRFYFTIVSR